MVNNSIVLNVILWISFLFSYLLEQLIYPNKKKFWQKKMSKSLVVVHGTVLIGIFSTNKYWNICTLIRLSLEQQKKLINKVKIRMERPEMVVVVVRICQDKQILKFHFLTPLWFFPKIWTKFLFNQVPVTCRFRFYISNEFKFCLE